MEQLLDVGFVYRDDKLVLETPAYFYTLEIWEEGDLYMIWCALSGAPPQTYVYPRYAQADVVEHVLAALEALRDQAFERLSRIIGDMELIREGESCTSTPMYAV